MPGPFTLLHRSCARAKLLHFYGLIWPKLLHCPHFSLARWPLRAHRTADRALHSHCESSERSPKVSCEAASSMPRTGAPPMTASSSESTSIAASLGLAAHRRSRPKVRHDGRLERAMIVWTARVKLGLCTKLPHVQPPLQRAAPRPGQCGFLVESLMARSARRAPAPLSPRSGRAAPRIASARRQRSSSPRR